jgi:hypothetical protein
MCLPVPWCFTLPRCCYLCWVSVGLGLGLGCDRTRLQQGRETTIFRDKMIPIERDRLVDGLWGQLLQPLMPSGYCRNGPMANRA